MELINLASPNSSVLRKYATVVQFPLDAATKQFIDEFQIFFANLKSPYGNPAGLAAPQVGTSLQIFKIQIPPEAKKNRRDVFDELPPTIFINPSYIPIESEGKYKDWEGCFSVENHMGEVNRYKAIEYEAYTLEGRKISGTAHGLLARIWQHEIGHLNGELFIDLQTPDCRSGTFDEIMKIRTVEMEQNKSS